MIPARPSIISTMAIFWIFIFVFLLRFATAYRLLSINIETSEVDGFSMVVSVNWRVAVAMMTAMTIQSVLLRR
jgi:hypothetical protein